MAPVPLADDDAYWRQFERDYYALLGVKRDASQEEIRARFLSLSREFHPDRLQKRQDASLVAVANTQYPILDRAYKVLSDPMTRHAYDVYGERGVAALDQSDALRHVVGLKLQSTDDAQREVERVLRRLNQQALEAQFSSFSEMSMGVDASDLMHAPMRGLRGLLRGDRRLIERTDMTIHQRTTFPLSRSTKLTLGGYMYDKQGLGMGAFTTRLEYASSDPSVPSVALSTELGWTPKINCQLSQPISPYTVVMWIPELDAHGLDMSFGVNQLLLPQLHGAMMWSTRDGLSASLSNDSQLAHNSVGVAVNRGGPNVSLQLRRLLSQATLTVKTSLRANLVTGLSLVAGASKQISQRTRFAMGVLLARAGVTLRLGFTRGSVRFVVPIFLSPFSAQSAFSTFLAATSPFVLSAVVAQLVKPAQERKRRRELEKKHETRRHYLSSARRCALAQQQLMVACAREKKAAEEAKRDQKGLVVLLARYGKDPTNPDATDRSYQPLAARGDDAENADADAPGSQPSPAMAAAATGDADSGSGDDAVKWVDVTVPMQFFVQDSTLALPGGTSKASLLGFYNPCAGQEDAEQDTKKTPLVVPQLYVSSMCNVDGWKVSDIDAAIVWIRRYVRYAYGGDIFEATFDDHQAVSLPSRFAQAMGKVGIVF
jgi:DnaJ homolog subfamily C member 11